jgi:hypothetical protein
MATKIQVKRGTTAQCDAETPDSGEPLYDTTLDQLRIGDGSTAGGDKVAMEGNGIARVFMANAFQYPAPGTDWTPQVEGAHLAQNLSAKNVWLPLNFLKIGDVITSYKLVGDAIEAAALTLDCKLVRVNKADPLTTTDITNGAITQVDADGNFDSEADNDDETVATDKQYVLEILGTTGAGDSITVMGAEVSVTRLP